VSKAAAGALTAHAEPATVGEEMLDLMRRLYPLRRSLTGDGVHETLALVSDSAPLAGFDAASRIMSARDAAWPGLETRDRR
jgi:aminopeptidase-like protein